MKGKKELAKQISETELKEYQLKWEKKSLHIKYPWDEWSNGRIWTASFGEDFQTKPESFRQYLHNEATKRGLKVHTRIITAWDAPPEVMFRFYHPDNDPGGFTDSVDPYDEPDPHREKDPYK